MNYYICKSRKGFALSLTLFIVAVLLLATVTIARFTKEELEITNGLSNKIQTDIMVNDAFEILKFYIPTSKKGSISLTNSLNFNIEPYNIPASIIVDGREYNLSKNLSISIKDTSGMINIMYEGAIGVASLFSSLKKEQEYLSHTLEDWRDEDNSRKLYGEEEYQNYPTRNNRAMQNIYELKLVKGYENFSIEELNKNLYYGRGNGLNLALIKSPSYLAKILDIELSKANELIELREKSLKDFISTIQKSPNYVDIYMTFYISNQFLVLIKAHQGNAYSILKVLINFKSLKNRAFSIERYNKY